jgi:hypothetical protein
MILMTAPTRFFIFLIGIPFTGCITRTLAVLLMLCVTWFAVGP